MVRNSTSCRLRKRTTGDGDPAFCRANENYHCGNPRTPHTRSLVSRQSTRSKSLTVISTAIHLLRDAGSHRPALESHLGPRRTQASHHDRAYGPLHIHVLLRSVADVLGSCDQVRESGTFQCLFLTVHSRSLNGALNGNIGVMKSVLAEITDPSNIAQAYAFLPLAWSTGATLG